ncbi:uncharacterized protein DNG_00613 [Cephalotrichum gorgonifer]|uniref:Uncharacterized protein n=1 Tax=Cephalotrichum gorgonifer TaxID=2041049 RepID=A0AAE8MRJ6_9PEZI|nr:uncharacterized protein DNG_00613 [Cephalotrichum gorgonifer]
MKRLSKLSLRSKKPLVADSSEGASGGASGSGQGQSAGISDHAAMLTAALAESADATLGPHDGATNVVGGTGNATGAPGESSSSRAAPDDRGNANNSEGNATYGGGGGGGSADERLGKRARARAYIGLKVDGMLFRFQRIWDKLTRPMTATTIADGGDVQAVAFDEYRWGNSARLDGRVCQ